MPGTPEARTRCEARQDGAADPAGAARLRRGAASAAVRGAARSLAVIGLFVAVGLAAAGVLGPESRPSAAYPGDVAPRSLPPREPPARPDALWLVDGFNVLHVGVLRGQAEGAWWGAEGRSRVLELAARFAAPAAELVVVFDGPHPAPDAGARDVRVVFAPSADAWLLARVREAEEPGRVVVVTADRRLAARARARGARVVAPAAFLACCADASEPPAV